MNLHLTIGPIVSLLAGILILVMPRLLNYIVAIYLIIVGLLGLIGDGNCRARKYPRRASSCAGSRDLQLPRNGWGIAVADDYLDAAVLLTPTGGAVVCHRTALALTGGGKP
jgi:Protein of unknown function (DUF3096)